MTKEVSCEEEHAGAQEEIETFLNTENNNYNTEEISMRNNECLDKEAFS